MTWLKLVEGYMPMQMITELAICILAFSIINYLLKRAGIGLPKFWAGIFVWAFVNLFYLKYRIYPPIPFSVRAIYGDLTSLIIGGQATNLGTQPLVITESDVALQGPDGSVYLLLSTNPPFPWPVPPGQTLQFFLTYQRPPADTAVFRVLNQGFQLTNLR
jgi:hypothetical protein